MAMRLGDLVIPVTLRFGATPILVDKSAYRAEASSIFRSLILAKVATDSEPVVL